MVKLTDQHPCTQSSEQPEVSRGAQLSKQLRNHMADPAVGSQHKTCHQHNPVLWAGAQQVDFNGATGIFTVLYFTVQISKENCYDP